MSRPLAAAFLFVLMVPALARDDKPPELYPLAKGTKWQYVVTVADKTVPVVTEVTESQTKDAKTTATVTAKTGDAKDIAEELTADAKGVYRNSISGVKTDRPLPIIKYPVKAGATWKDEIKINGKDATVTTTVGEEEEVKVPAGTYKAVPHDAVIRIGGEEVTAKSWYADGVGIVKQKMTFSGIKATMELKKFTAGNKAKD